MIKIYGYKADENGLTALVFNEDGRDQVAFYGSDSEAPTYLSAINPAEASAEKIMALGDYEEMAAPIEVPSLRKSEVYTVITTDMHQRFPF